MVIKTILLYYAIICLMLMPASIAILVIMYKRGMLRRFDLWLDSILEPKDGKIEQKPEDRTDPEKQDEDDDEDDEKKNRENYGIASFDIQVGDFYHCRLSSTARRQTIGAIEWESGNKFIGEIDSGEIFHSKKCGKVRLFTRRADDSYDTGAAVYDITVRPTNQNWFAQKMLDFILERRKMTDVYAALQNRKSITFMPARRLAVYDGYEPDEKSLAIQADASKCIARVLFEFKNTKETLASIERELNERFEHIETDGDIDIWIHGIRDEEKDIVDAYAWLKISQNKTILFGIGRSWRDESERDEFLYNLQMVEKTFSELVDDEPLAIVAATDAELKKLEAEDHPIRIDQGNGIPAGNDTTDKTKKEQKNEPSNNSASEAPSEGTVDPSSGMIDSDDIPDINDVPEEQSKEEEQEPSPEDDLDYNEIYPDVDSMQ